jgi:hypothetical protein
MIFLKFYGLFLTETILANHRREKFHVGNGGFATCASQHAQ